MRLSFTMISLLIGLLSRLCLYVVDFQTLCYCNTMCVILSCNSIHFIRQFQSFYAVKHVKLHDNLAYFIAWDLAVHKSNCAILYHDLMMIYEEKHNTNRIIPVRLLHCSYLLIWQRCKRCTFDSPGLTSESEVYPGSFAVSSNNAVGVVPFIY